MLLKNKTIRYKILFNIMKKINLFYKKKESFLFFTAFIFYFYFEHGLIWEDTY